MISILFSVVFGVVAYFFNKFIRNQFNIILGLTIIFSAVSFFIDIELATQGYMGLALYIIVMLAGAFRKDSKMGKRFRSVRKEYSILGFVVLLPHGIKYLLEFLDGSQPVEWFGIISYVVMIPLFIISFSYIKKKMNIKTWYKIQKWAYLAYAAVFVHLIVIGQSDHIMAYIAVFAFYSFLKLRNYVFKENSSALKTVKAIGITSVGVVISLIYTGTIDLPSVVDAYNPVEIEIASIEDGTYTGESSGFKNLDVSLSVVVSDGEITDIVIYEYGATSPHNGIDFEEAGDEMAEEIIATQDTGLDSISGATKTTEGIQDAVIDALS